MEYRLPVPQVIWDLLMKPLEEGGDGLEWDCDSKREIIIVDQHGLGRLDYLFGVTTPDVYNWKVKVFSLHSQCAITQVTFNYNLENCILKVEAVHTFN